MPISIKITRHEGHDAFRIIDTKHFLRFNQTTKGTDN